MIIRLLTKNGGVIGTDKPSIIVLGGTDSHIRLLNKLKQRGYYTILVDYLDAPLAKEYADLHIKESTYNKDAVLKIAKEYGATAVMTASADQVNTTACYVAEQLNLPRPYSYETAVRITNKAEMKKMMVDNGIPTTRYQYFEKENGRVDLRFPMVTKPVDNHGASGVKIAYNDVELERHLAEAKQFSKSGRIIVEEFFSGIEVSAYTVVKNGIDYIIMVSERLSVNEGPDQVMKCYATVAPAGISPKAMDKIREAGNRIAKGFDLMNTPLHIQAIVNGDDISIIEFAARVAGGLSTDIIKQSIGLDMFDISIDSWLNKSFDVFTKPLDKFYAVNNIYGSSGVYSHIDGIDELINMGIVEDFHCYRKKGSVISEEKANSCRVASFVTTASTREGLHTKAQDIYSRIKVAGVNGEDLTRRDLLVR